MEQISQSRTSNSTPGPPGWYRTYFSAVVESDREKALSEIARAQKAIQERVAELRHTPLNNPRERQDLDNASIYLGILLQHIGKTGSLLWD